MTDKVAIKAPNTYEDPRCQDVAGKPWMAAVQGATLCQGRASPVCLIACGAVTSRVTSDSRRLPMSLPASLCALMPQQTFQRARAAFPTGHPFTDARCARPYLYKPDLCSGASLTRGRYDVGYRSLQ